MRLAVAALGVVLLVSCGLADGQPRELPEWTIGVLHTANDQGFELLPLRTFLVEDWPSGEDNGGTLIYALVNPEGVNGWDINLDSAYFNLGKGQTIRPESQMRLYTSQHVTIGAVTFPRLGEKAERLDLMVQAISDGQGGTIGGRWLVEEILMRWGNNWQTDLTVPARMQFSNLQKGPSAYAPSVSGGVYKKGDIFVGVDVHEEVVEWQSPLRRPLIWVRDPDIHFVPFHLTFEAGFRLKPEPGWSYPLEHLPTP